jgi:hypothetical protein
MTKDFEPRPSASEPQYWELLSEDDKATYTQLKRGFSMGSTSRPRANKQETFDGMLDAIRQFAERDTEDDWRRFLVCGLCWMPNAIAINTRQLRLLISRCKSSINGSLQKMGYTTNMSHSESWKGLFPHIPLLKDHFRELRQWTIRSKGVPAPLEPIQAQNWEESLNVTEEPAPVGQKVPAFPLKFRGGLARAAKG